MTMLAQWRIKAACLGEDTELFFPYGSTGCALEQAEQAKAICAVRTECLDGAMVNNQQDGVWGGLSEGERRALRRGLQRRRRLQ
ncbi:MAG: WhiB family transcriptional regulator [Egibacteraceae bacterium]